MDNQTTKLGMSKHDGKNPKEQYVHSVFESISGKYDMMNDILSFRRHKAWRKFTMKKMNMRHGDTAIDLSAVLATGRLVWHRQVNPDT